jgi:hypothetical protein
VSPTKQDILVPKRILDVFGKASGLHSNLQKSEIFSIACGGLDLHHILEDFPVVMKSFPYRYLGLPLHPKKLRKVGYMPLLDKIGGKLQSWKGKLMTKAARAQLVKISFIFGGDLSYDSIQPPEVAYQENKQAQKNFFLERRRWCRR